MADLIAQSLREDLLAAFSDPGYRPPMLPSVALDVMSLTARDDVDVAEVVTLLERDEMLALALLRLAGSSVYAGRAPIRSLREAVVRLGIYVVRDAVFEVSLRSGVFRSDEYGDTVESIARHSTLTAYITRIICRRAGIDSDLAFICGLLHDVGFAGLLMAVKHVERESAPPLATLWPHVDALHERASLVLAQRWGLPAEVVEVIGHHHHIHTGKFARVASAVRIADHLTESFGASVRGPWVSGQALPGDLVGVFDLETAAADLGIDDGGLARIRADAERTLAEISLF
ncbi:MAG TPA: HDOD domain-containing protein [Polyangiaceae bacterium]